jgi:DNA-binding MurR/RpiR family transcriptional regulator
MILAAITSIVEAERIVVVGLRSSHSAAHWLSFTLNIIKGNTFLYRGEIDDANYMIGQLNSKSVVIALSFPRYAQETLQIVKGAKSQGAKIIGITDEYLTPFGQEIDILLKVVTPKPTSLKGMTVVFFLLNILMNGVMVKDWEKIQERLKNYESTTGKFFPFIQVDD